MFLFLINLLRIKTIRLIAIEEINIHIVGPELRIKF